MSLSATFLPSEHVCLTSTWQAASYNDYDGEFFYQNDVIVQIAENIIVFSSGSHS